MSVSSWLRWRLAGKGLFDPVPLSTALSRTPVVRIGEAMPAGSADTVVIVASPSAHLAIGSPGAMAAHLVESGSDLVYTDSALVSEDGVRSVHKPGWSPNLLRSGPYLGPAFAVRRGLLGRAGGTQQQGHRLLLNLMDVAHHIDHVDRIWASSPTLFGIDPDPDGITAAFAASGMMAAATSRGDWARISLTPADERSTTTIIPTRNGAQRVGDLLAELVRGNAYDRLDVIVVDNGSDDGVTRPLLDELAAQRSIRVIDHPGPFNFSAINNRALDAVETELVLFLNDDVVPGDTRWLPQLTANLDDPSVVAAGPLLLFPDGRIQHAGVVLGLGGVAGHPFGGRLPDDDGYFGWALARRDVAAVTAACMLARTEQVRAVGGFDEGFPTDFGDVDLCLKLRDLGTTVVDPVATLTHVQSASRGHRDADPEAARRFLSKWSAERRSDPWYSWRLPAINPGYTL